uniref:Uncharacterized protein n=1 Tax=Candidatus Nitrotoga fabula TaxID=2182327 RepID=A0A2X0QTX0_9PROT|nr:protein of unknown function [Candidatus Nitrotoga fabula]
MITDASQALIGGVSFEWEDRLKLRRFEITEIVYVGDEQVTEVLAQIWEFPMDRFNFEFFNIDHDSSPYNLCYTSKI